jgi:hypothetical protein
MTAKDVLRTSMALVAAPREIASEILVRVNFILRSALEDVAQMAAQQTLATTESRVLAGPIHSNYISLSKLHLITFNYISIRTRTVSVNPYINFHSVE